MCVWFDSSCGGDMVVRWCVGGGDAVVCFGVVGGVSASADVADAAVAVMVMVLACLDASIGDMSRILPPLASFL